MHDTSAIPAFHPLPPARPGLVSWLHIGDLHMVHAGAQNHQDLGAIVDEINRNFADKDVSFVFLPGDIADDGSARAYTAVREQIDRLHLPWCGIVGDHDVHEKSFHNFQQHISPELFSAFTVGDVEFFRLNAFSSPRPDSFDLSSEQLDWLEQKLRQRADAPSVVLLHCYPSDLKQGGDRLTSLLRQYPVRLVDMGHTHYNEISNDGDTLFSATRSTGQIEEGPVGYSLTSLDGNVVSWHFIPLGTDLFVSITTPADRRLLTHGMAQSVPSTESLTVRASAWGRDPIRSVELSLEPGAAPGHRLPMHLENGSWTATLPAGQRSGHIEVVATDAAGRSASDRIQLAAASAAAPDRASVDQDNALGAWPERGLLGTQLGPNKNGRKW